MMHYDFFEIDTESKKASSWSSTKFPLPFCYHVVTYPPLSPELEGKQQLHYHNIFEIHYVLEGIHHAIVNQTHYQTPPGGILVIGPNDTHASLLSEQQVKTYRIMVNNDHLISLGIFFENLTIQPRIDNDPIMTEFMHTMYLDSTQEKQNNYVNCYALSLQMLVYLRRTYAKPLFQTNKSQDTKLKMVQNAVKYMENNFAESFSFHNLAKELGYSQYYFSRTFSEILGTTASKYLQQLRCTNATKMLETGLYTISEVGERCGFSSPSYFIKTYKKMTGHLPTQDKK